MAKAKKDYKQKDRRNAIQRGRTSATSVQVWGLEPSTKRDFKSACAAKRLTMREVLESLMKGFVRGRIQIEFDRFGQPRPGRTRSKIDPLTASALIAEGEDPYDTEPSDQELAEYEKEC